jgi:hypothetical protein
MTPSVNRGTNNYGGQDFGSPCLDDDKKEQPFTSDAADVSRNTFNYFSSNTHVYLDGTVSGGISGVIETGNGNKQAINRAVNFMKNDYVLIGDSIYKYNDDTSMWEIVVALTGKTAASTSSLGLYPVFINNRPHLVTAWSVANGATWRFAMLNGDTDTWTVSSALAGGLAITDANGGILNEVQHGSKIYYLTSSNTSFGWFDFQLGTFGTKSFSNTSRHPMDICGYMGELYILNKDGTDNIQVLKVTSTGTELELNFNTGTPSAIAGINVLDTLTNTDQFEGRPMLFVDNVYDSGNPTLWMYYACHGSTAGHTTAGGLSTSDTNHGLHGSPMYLDSNGDLVGKPASGTLPVVGFRANPFKMMQNQESFANLTEPLSRKDEDMVLRVFVDQKDRGIDGLGVSSIVCASRFAGQQGCTGSPGGGGDFGNLFYHVFRGSGNADGGTHPNPPTKDGGAHAFDFIGFPAKQTRHRAFPHSRLGGGARHSEIVDNNRIADIVYRGTGTTGQDGVIRIFYSIIPSSGNLPGSSVDVRWWHDRHGHAPETPCTLIGTSHGSISGLLAASVQVDAATTYYVDWAAKDDGLQRYQRYTLNGQINLDDITTGAINDPSDLSNLVSWFDASDATSITMDGGFNVSVWNDKATGISGVTQVTPANQPTFTDADGDDGIRFTRANSEFLFSSGSPIVGQASTVFAVYKPVATTDGALFSLSNDTPGGTGDLTTYEYWSGHTTGSKTELRDQDGVRQASGVAQRVVILASGGEINKTRLVAWRNAAFEGEGQIFPSGVTQETDFSINGSVEANDLSNTTFGRFSGAQIASVYSGATDYWDGILKELVIYDRILSDTEIERFKLYAEAKWTLDI